MKDQESLVSADLIQKLNNVIITEYNISTM